MSRELFMAIEVARYIGLGMDLQAARSMAEADWQWCGGRTYEQRTGEARARLRYRGKDRRDDDQKDYDEERTGAYR